MECVVFEHAACNAYRSPSVHTETLRMHFNLSLNAIRYWDAFEYDPFAHCLILVDCELMLAGVANELPIILPPLKTPKARHTYMGSSVRVAHSHARTGNYHPLETV
jgi:hypothetical protein